MVEEAPALRLPSRSTFTALLVLAAVSLAELTWAAPPPLPDGVHGWRQSDVQTIARNFAFTEFSLLRPRIAWGGDGPGYVDTELQLHPALIALGMRLAGDSERPGRVLSLACMLLAAWILFRALAMRFGPEPALVALLAFLGTRAFVFTATAIVPESLAFLLYITGFLAFLRFVESGARAPLVVACLATTLCALIKPPALQLVLAQAALVLFSRRALFRRPEPWLSWAVTLLAVAGFFHFLAPLDPEHGNSLGIAAGGADRFPRIENFMLPATLRGLVRMTVLWGTGPLAGLVALGLAWRRQLSAVELALGVGALAMCLATAHVTSHMSASFLHVFSAFAGAWLVAHGARATLDARPSLRCPAMALTVFLVAAMQFALTARVLAGYHYRSPETALGEALRPLVANGQRVIVRAQSSSRDPSFGTANNFHDPRILYAARARGWVLPSDGAIGLLADASARGARYYVEPGIPSHDATLDAWLAANARLVQDLPEGRIYSLRQPVR